jgi:hypothetical protein
MRHRVAERDGEVERLVAAQRAAEEAGGALRAKLLEAEERQRAAEAELKGLRLEHERATAQLQEREAEVRGGRERVQKVETEMRLVLKAMEQQKQVENRNMSQLSRLCEEWHGGANRVPQS